MLELLGDPKSSIVIEMGPGHVCVSYDRKGRLRSIRAAQDGRPPEQKPKTGETIFRVQDFSEGESTFKSGGSHCGYFSANGTIFWSTIWADAGPSIVKKCSFHDWILECAQVLSGERSAISTSALEDPADRKGEPTWKV